DSVNDQNKPLYGVLFILAAGFLLASVVGTLVMTVLVVFNWQTPELQHGLAMAALGAIAMSGHMLLTHAFKYASAATLAPFTYGQIIFAGIVGFIAFRHVPDAGALIGMTIVIVSGLGSAYVQRQQRIEAQACTLSNAAVAER